MVSAMSFARAAISMASVPSAISSPAPAPTMPTPSTRSVAGSMTSFGHAFGAIESHRAPGCGPGELRNLDLAIFLLRLSFGQTRPCDFRIGEDDGRNGIRFECNFVSRNVLDCGAAFMRGFVCQHGLAHHVADCVDGRIISLQMLVDLNEPALTGTHLRAIEAGNF